MASYNIICSGPGPHAVPDGILGTSSTPVSGMFCGATVCQPAPDATAVNADTLRQQAVGALTTNRSYLALPSPTAAQTTAEVKALARQNNGLIRLLLGQFDGTD